MRLTITYSKIKKRNLVLINNGTYQRETLSERPIRQPLTLVILRVFPKHIFLGGVYATPLWIINTEGHLTLNLLPVYRYGHLLSIDTNISTNH